LNWSCPGGATRQAIAAPETSRVNPRTAQVGADKPPLDLAARMGPDCRTRPGPAVDLALRPVSISSGTPRLVQLALAGVRRFSLTAQLVQAGTYGREVVGSARSGHVSSHPLGRVFAGALWPELAGPDRNRANFRRQVSAFLDRPRVRREVRGQDGRCGGSHLNVTKGPPRRDGDTALGYGVQSPLPLPPQLA